MLGEQAPGELLDLEGQEAPVGAELQDVGVDVGGDAADHLHELEHRGDVTDGDEVLDLQGVQAGGGLVEAGLVTLQGGQGLVGAGQDRLAGLQDVALAVHVQGDDPHRLAHGDDRVPGLAGHALGGAVTHARLRGLDRGVGQQLDVGAPDPGGVHVDDDAAVHLGQLAQAGGGELDVQVEAARGDGLHHRVEAQHDDRPGTSAQDPLQSVTKDGAGSNERKRLVQLASGLDHHLS